MLRMEEVSKSYQHRGQVVKALDGATIDIPRGDFVSVVGPSGSGKSTLLLMLGGMLSPSSGRVLLEDESIYDLTSDGRARLRKENIGFVFQTFNLVPYLTALENVQIPLFLAGAGRQVARGESDGPPGARGTRRPPGPQADGTECRSATAGRLGPNAGQRSGGHSGRRAHRQPRPGNGRSGHRVLRGVQRRRPDDRDGDTRPEGSRACQEDVTTA